MPEIEIRQVVLADVENLSIFEHGYHSSYVWQMNMDLALESMEINFIRIRLPRQVFVSYPRNRDQIFNDLNNAEAVLVAILDQQPVGYIKVMAEGSNHVARVSDLVVSTAFRRQGIASGLLLTVMDLVSRRGFSALMLEIQSKNDPAITMAAKLGFKYCGFRDQYFPNDDLALFFSRFSH